MVEALIVVMVVARIMQPPKGPRFSFWGGGGGSGGKSEMVKWQRSDGLNEGREKRRLASVFSRLQYQAMTDDQRTKLSIEYDGLLRRWKTEGNIICLALEYLARIIVYYSTIPRMIERTEPLYVLPTELGLVIGAREHQRKDQPMTGKILAGLDSTEAR